MYTHTNSWQLPDSAIQKANNHLPTTKRSSDFALVFLGQSPSREKPSNKALANTVVPRQPISLGSQGKVVRKKVSAGIIYMDYMVGNWVVAPQKTHLEAG